MHWQWNQGILCQSKCERALELAGITIYTLSQKVCASLFRADRNSLFREDRGSLLRSRIVGTEDSTSRILSSTRLVSQFK